MAVCFHKLMKMCLPASQFPSDQLDLAVKFLTSPAEIIESQEPEAASTASLTILMAVLMGIPFAQSLVDAVCRALKLFARWNRALSARGGGSATTARGFGA